MDFKKIKSKKGFTLIELMVVIVIIGILVAIALPNFIAAQDRAKISSVKANMHTLQTVLETYAVDWGGTYATNTVNLKTEANGTGKTYWKEFKNPFSNAAGPSVSYVTWTTAINATTGVSTGLVPGIVAYDPSGSPITKYYLYGGSKDSATAIVDKGATFYLTNN
ncbi:MAG: type II secretion system protein [Candidatus Sericytochromatia bacterium]